MTAETQSVLALCEQLSATRRAELLDFARFLLEREQGGLDDAGGDEAWERLIGDSKPRPKLDAFTEAALGDGSEPMDPDKL